MQHDPRLQLMRKTCTTCHENKPWAEFDAREKWPDGTMRAPASRCKQCRRAECRDRMRRKYQQDAEWRESKLARTREYREQLRQDPQAWAEYVARARESQAAYRRRQGIGVSEVHTLAPDREVGGHIDIAPFRAWLLEQIPRCDDDRGVLADRLGTSERVIYRWLHESRSIQLDTLDAALCSWGDPFLLAELHPELYEDVAA